MATEIETNLIERVAMGDIFRRKANAMPRKEAVCEWRNGERIVLTYERLNDDINRFARALRSLGLRRKDKVALISPNSIEFLVSLYGCMKGGFIVVPINYLLNLVDIVYILNHAEVCTLIVEDSLTPMIDKILDDLPKVKHLITLTATDTETCNRYLKYPELMAAASADEIEDTIIKDRDTAQIMYTSGTTSKPKGVVTSHLSLFIATLTNAIELNLQPGVVASCVMPLFHMAQEAITTTLMHLGGKTVIGRGFDPKLLLDAIQNEKLEFVLLLPMMWKTLLDYPGVEDIDFSSLKTGLYGMAPMDKRSLDRVVKEFDCRLMSGSGQTEMTPVACVFKSKWAQTKQGNYWGEPALTVDQAVINDVGECLPQGEVGEIVWRSPQVMSSYFRNDQATDESRAFGWHHSGDLGYIDEDGLLMFVDRKKDMVKSGGENVPTVKVEQVIMENPKVQGVAVVGLPHERWTEAITAFVSPKAGLEPTEEEIIATCKKELAGFEVPKRILIVDEIPKTATGKFQKNLLRETYQNLYYENV